MILFYTKGHWQYEKRVSIIASHSTQDIISCVQKNLPITEAFSIGRADCRCLLGDTKNNNGSSETLHYDLNTTLSPTTRPHNVVKKRPHTHERID